MAIGLILPAMVLRCDMGEAEQHAMKVAPLNFFGWREIFKKEDWWAIWLGVGITLLGCALFAGGGSLKWLAVTPAKWNTLSQLGADLSTNYLRYSAQFLFWVALFSIALKTLGYKLNEFIAGFLFVYVVSVAIFALGQWTQANKYNLEPPLIALMLGLLLSNVIGLPRWLDAAFRVEFYVKTGIVLLGATLPFTLIYGAARSPSCRRRSFPSSLLSSFSGRAAGWGSIHSLPPRSAPAELCAACQPLSQSLEQLAPKRNMLLSPSQPSSSGRSL